MAALLATEICTEFLDGGSLESPATAEYLAEAPTYWISNLTPHGEECEQCEE